MTTPAVAQRAACPACGAATRLGDPWCTLCYADLSPAAADPAPAETAVAPAETEPAVVPVAGTGIVTDEAQQLSTDEVGTGAAEPDPAASPLAGVTMPCPACEEPVPVLVGTCPVCGTDMLAPLRGADAAHQSQFVREMMAMSRAARLSMAAGLAAALLIVIFVVTAIV